MARKLLKIRDEMKIENNIKASHYGYYKYGIYLHAQVFQTMNMLSYWRLYEVNVDDVVG